jgi:protein SCO1
MSAAKCVAWFVSGVVLAACCGCGSGGKPLPRHQQVGAFDLTNANGRTVTATDLRGQIWVADFILTSCSSECYVMGTRMKDIQQRTEGMADVRLVSFTTDPRGDTPPLLAAYAHTLKADTNRWLFLTGDKRRLYALIQESLLPAKVMNQSEREILQTGVIHSSKVVVVDAQGWVRAYFNGMNRETPFEVVEVIKRLRAEGAEGGTKNP